MVGVVGYSAALDDQGAWPFSVLKTSLVDVMAVCLDAPAETSTSLWQLLSRDERARAEKYHFARDRQNYVVARATLRRLLGKRLRIAPELVEFTETEYGKPRIAAVHGAVDAEFNVSHSGSLALFAFASGRAIGVDVELIREIPDADDLAERFFSAAEVGSLNALPREKRSLAFLTCWTRKEAVIKALGMGLSCPLDAFDVTIDPDAPADITRMDGIIGQAADWAVSAFKPGPRYIAAVVCHREGRVARCLPLPAA
jgi:4'-phosphopantetheinyl transferase